MKTDAVTITKDQAISCLTSLQHSIEYCNDRAKQCREAGLLVAARWWDKRAETRVLVFGVIDAQVVR